jgi:protein ImuA
MNASAQFEGTFAQLEKGSLTASLRTAESPALHPRVPLGHEAADACLKGGLLKGALHEVFAAEAGCEGAATGFATALAMRMAAPVGTGQANERSNAASHNDNAQSHGRIEEQSKARTHHKKLLWIRHDFSALEFGEISATGLLELGLDPARVLVLRVADVTEALRAAGDALTCGSLGAVILEIPGAQKKLDLVTSRRLTLAAQKKGVSVFLLRLAAEPDTSSAETRWRIAPAPSDDRKDDWGFPRLAAQLARNRHGPTGDWVMEWNSDEQSFRAADRGPVVSVPADGPHRQAAAR